MCGKKGTANYCKISGIDVAAKTGTTNDDYDRWLCGFTPYYTAVTWFGFDYNETINFNRKNPSGQIWANVIKAIHTGLEKASFEVPKGSGIEKATICEDTGLLAYSTCPNTYIEYYLNGTVPTASCNKHYKSNSSTTIKAPEEKNNNNNNNGNNDNKPQETKPTETVTPAPSTSDNKQEQNNSNNAQGTNEQVNTNVPELPSVEEPNNTITEIPSNTTSNSDTNTVAGNEVDDDDDIGSFFTDDDTFAQ